MAVRGRFVYPLVGILTPGMQVPPLPGVHNLVMVTFAVTIRLLLALPPAPRSISVPFLDDPPALAPPHPPTPYPTPSPLPIVSPPLSTPYPTSRPHIHTHTHTHPHTHSHTHSP